MVAICKLKSAKSSGNKGDLAARIACTLFPDKAPAITCSKNQKDLDLSSLESFEDVCKSLPPPPSFPSLSYCACNQQACSKFQSTTRTNVLAICKKRKISCVGSKDQLIHNLAADMFPSSAFEARWTGAKKASMGGQAIMHAQSEYALFLKLKKHEIVELLESSCCKETLQSIGGKDAPQKQLEIALALYITKITGEQVISRPSSCSPFTPQDTASVAGVLSKVFIAEKLKPLLPNVLEHLTKNYIFHLNRTTPAVRGFCFFFLCGLLHWGGIHKYCRANHCHQTGFLPTTERGSFDLEMVRVLYNAMLEVCLQLSYFVTKNKNVTPPPAQTLPWICPKTMKPFPTLPPCNITKREGAPSFDMIKTQLKIE